MLIVIPISKNDFNDPINVFGFVKAIKHFGSCSKHNLLVITRPEDYKYGQSVYDEIKHLFFDSFIYAFLENGPSGWPSGPNFYWKNTIQFLKEVDNTLPWFWMELDVYPLKVGWVDALEKEYYASKKPCLGLLQNTTTITKKGYNVTYAKHVQGTAVYPAKLHEYSKVWEHVDEIDIAFDVLCSWELVPLTCDTKLIQQGFRTIDYKFDKQLMQIKGRDRGDYNGAVKYDDPLDPTAVVHHGCKDNSLVEVVTSSEYHHFLNFYKTN